MKLSVWAKEQGISYKTAWRWWKAGTMPVPVEQLASGTIIVHPAKFVANHSFGNVALYARVSSADQKADLDRQFDRLSEYALAHKMSVVDSVKEIGSDLNSHRRGMIRLLANSNIQTIVVEHRNRLMPFGF
jgi:putative resolvase